MVDLGTGNNTKINWGLADVESNIKFFIPEFIAILDNVYYGAKKGRGLVVSPKDYSTKLKY